MMPTKGQYVQVIFRNETQLRGTIETWSDIKSVLILDDDNSCLIMNTAQDVMIVKILPKPKTQENLQQEMTQINTQFEQVKAEPSANDLRLKKLADLKKMMIEQEKRIVAEKVKSHTITESFRPQYNYPSFMRNQ